MVAKMYECIIGDSIDCHFINKGLSSENQWGFKPNRSTELLMLHLTEIWRQELDRNRIVGVLFIDFKKAFDSICHKTMALKLQACGVSGNMYNLIVDCLSGRKQFVEIEGQRSSEQEVKFGVPQGSALGPRLFNIYVNDLPQVPSCGKMEMFADDTTLYCIGDSMDDVCSKIQVSITEIAKWCNRNISTIHPNKTEILFLTRKDFIGPLKPIKLGDHEISFVNKSHCLGFTIDNKLSWEYHINDLASSMSKKVKQLRRFKSLPSQILEQIYFKDILPSVTYGISVWGNCSEAKLGSLEKIHLSAAKLIFKQRIPPSWKSISYLYKKRLLCLTHKAYYGLCPDQVATIIKKSPNLRNMRDSFKLTLDRPNCNVGKLSFKHRSAMAWNSLPKSVKSIEDHNSFKNKLRYLSSFIDKISFNQSAIIYNKDLTNYVYF